VPAGSRIRAHSTLSEVVDRSAAVQGRITVTVEIEGDDKPACIAEMLGLYYPA
jgi:acyl dehydratase